MQIVHFKLLQCHFPLEIEIILSLTSYFTFQKQFKINCFDISSFRWLNAVSMAKRKIKFDLNDFVIGYLKKSKYEKTLKIYDASEKTKKCQKTDFEKFVDYLKVEVIKKEIKTENDDLGFEINFGAYEQQVIAKLPTKKTGHLSKKEKPEKKIEIPKEFIKKIEKLGMRKEDADVLYRSKIDWTAVYSENKIYCIEPKCNFSSQIDSEELRDHMITIHKYGKYPCLDSDCDYVAFSKVRFLSPNTYLS